MKTGESSFSFGFNTENNLDYPIVQKFYENGHYYMYMTFNL